VKALRFALLALAALGLAPSARAAENLDKAPAVLDPAKAYVLVRLGERAPDTWNVLMLSPYDAAAQDLRGRGRAKGNPVSAGDDERVMAGSGRPLVDAPHVRTYLLMITPGRYVLSNSATTCFCLGSFQFTAEAGRITDLGTIYIGPENGTSPWGVLAKRRSSPDIEDIPYAVADAMAVYPFKEGMSMPPAIMHLPRVAAVFTPASRLGNHYGRLINQALPLGGVR